MEAIDVIDAWQIRLGDLIQFEAYDKDGGDDARYIELIRVQHIDLFEEYGYVTIRGESLRSGDIEQHELDIYLEVEVMGA